MTACGYKETSSLSKWMSALPPRADVTENSRHDDTGQLFDLKSDLSLVKASRCRRQCRQTRSGINQTPVVYAGYPNPKPNSHSMPRSNCDSEYTAARPRRSPECRQAPTGRPSRKTTMPPRSITCHGSWRVKGCVVITVTISRGVVSLAKSTVSSVSIRRASPKGARRVSQLRSVLQWQYR